ncbi:hypothetical protein AB0L06_13755 [Spirillospora sp. NPDC052269]
MRNIPVDTTALTFVCVSPPRPKLVSQETGEIKVDKEGNTVFTVGLSAADAMGRVELINVSVSHDPDLTIGQVVQPVGLIGMAWEQNTGGRQRWGIAYRAKQLTAVTPAVAAVADAA